MNFDCYANIVWIIRKSNGFNILYINKL